MIRTEMAVVARILAHAARIVGRGWCQDALARDCQGTAVYLDDPNATNFCASGAIRVAARGLENEEEMYVRAVTCVACSVEDGPHFFRPRNPGGRRQFFIAYWNDNPQRTKAQVVATLRKAAALAKAAATR